MSPDLLTIAGLTALTAVILGVDAYRSYFLNVLPRSSGSGSAGTTIRSGVSGAGCSIPHPNTVGTDRLPSRCYYSPILAKVFSLVSSAVIIGILARAVRDEQALAPNRVPLTRPSADLSRGARWRSGLHDEGRSDVRPGGHGDAPGLADLLGALPPALAGSAGDRLDESAGVAVRAVLFLTIVAAFWIGYPVTWTAFGLNGRTATPVDSLGILSYQFYALLGFFALTMMISRRGNDTGALAFSNDPSPLHCT